VTVRVDTSQLDRKLNQVEKGLTKYGLKSVTEYATRELERVTRAAFRGKHDPTTFAPWSLRKGGQSWPALERSGTLAAALGFHAKVLKYAAWTKATMQDIPLPRPTKRAKTYVNLAFIHWWGTMHKSGTLAPRKFFFEWGSKKRRVEPPAWFQRRVKIAAVRAARRAVG